MEILFMYKWFIQSHIKYTILHTYTNDIKHTRDMIPPG